MTTKSDREYEQLRLSGLHAFYGESHILHGIDMVVNRGELVTLLGRNGAGRSTTLKAIMNMVGRRTGSIMINGEETMSCAPHHIARLGVGYCPEHRGIFSSLSVQENLTLPPVVRSGGMSLEEIYNMFPNLYERRFSQGTKLSGGEQQMLAIARGLMAGPRILLLDEPSMGLSPKLTTEMFLDIRRIARAGRTVVIVEQNAFAALSVADHGYVLEGGRIALEGSAAQLLHDDHVRDAYLGA